MNELSDYHVHTSFSGDSSAPPEAMVKEAIRRGIRHLCLTDHMDYDYADADAIFEFDSKSYFQRLMPLQEKYAGQIDLAIGVELGLQPYLSVRHHSLVFSHPFDFVIGSVHLVHRRDPYYPSYFEGRTESEAYQEYFESVLQNLEAFSNFDVFGHLDYVVRYSSTKNQDDSYHNCQDLIDEILRSLIRKDIGLEINTAGYRYGLGAPNPCRNILLRYRELGGRLITLGSDAHSPEALGYGFGRAAALARECGFSSYYVYHNRRPTEIGLEPD